MLAIHVYKFFLQTGLLDAKLLFNGWVYLMKV